MNGNILREKNFERGVTASVGFTLSNGVGLSEEVMIYKKRETSCQRKLGRKK